LAIFAMPSNSSASSSIAGAIGVQPKAG